MICSNVPNPCFAIDILSLPSTPQTHSEYPQSSAASGISLLTPHSRAHIPPLNFYLGTHKSSTDRRAASFSSYTDQTPIYHQDVQL